MVVGGTLVIILKVSKKVKHLVLLEEEEVICP
jgi:hypothetical protein